MNFHWNFNSIFFHLFVCSFKFHWHYNFKLKFEFFFLKFKMTCSISFFMRPFSFSFLVHSSKLKELWNESRTENFIINLFGKLSKIQREEKEGEDDLLFHCTFHFKQKIRTFIEVKWEKWGGEFNQRHFFSLNFSFHLRKFCIFLFFST